MLDKAMTDVSVQDVLTAVKELQSFYNTRNRKVNESVELYNRTVSLKTPDGIIPVITHAATTICERGADRLGGGRFQNHIDPRREGTTEEDHVEALEEASSAIFWMARKRIMSNPVRTWALHAFNRGGMVAKIQLDLDCLSETPAQSDYPTEKAFKAAQARWLYKQIAEFPVIIDARPIENIYPDPESEGAHFVIEAYKRKVGDIKKNFPNPEFWATYVWERKANGTFLGRTFRDDEMVEYIEIWTQQWRGVIVEGQWIPIGENEAGPVLNLYGRPPYFLRYPFGDPTGKPEERVVSPLRAIQDELLMESRMMTVVQSVAESNAYGATVIHAKDESAKATIGYGPGYVIESDMPDGQRPTPLIPQANLRDALQALQVAQAAASEGAVPSEARGAASPSRTGQPSGVAAAILTGQASMVIDPVKGAIEDMVSDIIPFVFYILDTVWEGKLKLYGQVGKDKFVNLDLDSATIDGHYGPVYVTLKLQAPEENHASWNLGIQAAQTGKFPAHWVLETFFAVENAAAMLEDAHADRLAESEMTDMYLNERLIEKLRAKSENVADAMPGAKVPAPSMAPSPPAPMVSADGMAGPPMDPMARATAGIAAAPQVPGGVPVTAPMA